MFRMIMPFEGNIVKHKKLKICLECSTYIYRKINIYYFNKSFNKVKFSINGKFRRNLFNHKIKLQEPGD